MIAAACAAEAFKYATYSYECFNNYMMFNGTDGLYVHTFEYERTDDCLVCGQEPVPFTVRGGNGHAPIRRVLSVISDELTTMVTVRPQVASTDTVATVLDKMTADPKLQLKQPSVRADGKSVYMRTPASLEEATRPNLDKPATEFFAPGTLGET
eukprot:SAG31_NODE_223_length_19859_cov_14.949899_16_plen_154_part_00